MDCMCHCIAEGLPGTYTILLLVKYSSHKGLVAFTRLQMLVLGHKTPLTVLILIPQAAVT